MGGAGAPSKNDKNSFEEMEFYLAEVYKNIDLHQIINTINDIEFYDDKFYE